MHIVRQETLAEIADYVERFGLAVRQGPAVKEYATPVNRLRHDAEFADEFVLLTAVLASNIRAGLVQPESDWPLRETGK